MVDKEKNSTYSKLYYEKDLREIICSNCNTTFIGKRNRKTCSKECTKQAKLDGMEIHHHITKCTDCCDIIKDQVKYGKKAKDIIKYKRCQTCSKKHRELYFKNRNNKKIEDKIDNPLYIKKETKSGIMYYDKEKYDIFVNNMSVNNPMFSDEIRNKTSNTIKEKIKTGELKYKNGTDHHLWRGNRDNNHIIRSRLYKWRKSILIKYNYECFNCNCTEKLEVHHTEPLRDIISKFTNKPLSKYTNDTDDFKNLIICVINYHNVNDVGVLLCEKCHSDIDNHRNIRK